MNEFVLIAGMALVTFGIRIIIFPISRRMAFPPLLERALRYVPPAVLTAIIFPAVFIPDGKNLYISLSNAHLMGALIAGGVGWLTRNLVMTILSGMAGFWVWQWIRIF